MRTSTIGFALGFAIASSAGLSFIHPWGDVRGAVGGDEILAGSNASPQVQQLLADKCGDCHSDQTRWPIYGRFAPGSWLMERDVAEGRLHMNLSKWQEYGPESQLALLARISAKIRTSEMPLKTYLWLHPTAQLSAPERQMISDWSRKERRQIRETHLEKQR